MDDVILKQKLSADIDIQNNNQQANYRKNILALFSKSVSKSDDSHSTRSVTDHATNDTNDTLNNDQIQLIKQADENRSNDSKDKDTNCTKNASESDSNDARARDNEGRQSAQARVNTTSFSVTDILDPQKFTGSSKDARPFPVPAWMRGDDRHENEVASDEENGMCDVTVLSASECMSLFKMFMI